jgi:hypothetical protein
MRGRAGHSAGTTIDGAAGAGELAVDLERARGAHGQVLLVPHVRLDDLARDAMLSIGLKRTSVRHWTALAAPGGDRVHAVRGLDLGHDGL